MADSETQQVDFKTQLEFFKETYLNILDLLKQINVDVPLMYKIDAANVSLDILKAKFPKHDDLVENQASFSIEDE